MKTVDFVFRIFTRLLVQNNSILTGGFFGFFVLYVLYCIKHSRPSDSTVSEDAGIEPRTVATSALAVKRSNHIDLLHINISLVKMNHDSVSIFMT
jgi:hypothetical protein